MRVEVVILAKWEMRKVRRVNYISVNELNGNFQSERKT